MFEHRFSGQWHDAESGLFHNGFRDYHARAGRFIQANIGRSKMMTKRSITVGCGLALLVLALLCNKGRLYTFFDTSSLYLTDNATMDTFVLYDERHKPNYDCKIDSDKFRALIHGASETTKPLSANWHYVLHFVGRENTKIYIADETMLFDGSKYFKVNGNLSDVLFDEGIIKDDYFTKCLKEPEFLVGSWA